MRAGGLPPGSDRPVHRVRGHFGYQQGQRHRRCSPQAPTTNTDGAGAHDLAGYRIYYGMNADDLTQTVQPSRASVSRRM